MLNEILYFYCILCFFFFSPRQFTSVPHNISDFLLILVKISPSVTESAKLAGLQSGSLNVTQDLFLNRILLLKPCQAPHLAI